MRRTIFEPEHEQFRETVREYIAREVAPRSAQWEAAGIVDRSAYAAAGKHGVIGFNVPAEFGGGGVDDFRFNAVVSEELGRYGASAPALTLQNDILAPYLVSLGTGEQKRRWLPGFARGELIAAIAMSEPGAGSDLAGVRTCGVRDGDDWIVSGAKTFISSGINADLVIVVTRTDQEAGHKGFTLLVVERDMPGFSRGRKLAKMGQHSQDTAELFFDRVRVPAANVLGEVNRGFYHLMRNLPSERMSIAVNAVAGAREIFDQTLEYGKHREAFGRPIGSFQYNRFRFAEMETELDIAQAYIDRCLAAILDGELTAVDAAKAKWWTTELQKRVVDSCLQLHGGYGYMTEYAVSRAYTDSRIQTIYGGTTEIMKDIIGKSLGLLEPGHTQLRRGADMTGQRSEVARTSGPVTGGKGWPFGSPLNVEQYGCVLEEFLIEGVAQSYEPTPGSTVGLDGRWSVQPADTAEYRTRMYVVRPSDPARFNGVVVVNWQNVTVGVDFGAPSPHEMRSGYAWVGVTTQRVAIEGQPPLRPGMADTKGLPAADPDRYGSLRHPGDRYCYDIFTQAARAVGPGRPATGADPLSGLAPGLVLATGFSQSAMRLGSYLNLVDDRERFFDGFLLTVHWGLCPYPPDQSIQRSFKPLEGGLYAGSSAINDRGRVPVLVLSTESETLHNLPVRQPDSPTFRFWEMAGTAHAGSETGAELNEILADVVWTFLQRDAVNTIDWSWVRNAALEHLVRWAGGGEAPPSFPPVDASLTGGIHADDTGNATGGIRLPDLEVPTARHSGTNDMNPLAALSGQSIPFTPEQIEARYQSAEAYLRQWDTAVDRVREQGLVLDADLDLLRGRGRKTAGELWPKRRHRERSAPGR